MGEPLRALVLEDSESDAILLLRELEKAGFAPSYERMETAEQLSDALAREPWDVIITDYYMPHLDAPKAIEIIRATGRDIPIIVVSGTVGEDIAVQTMKAGAHDYLLKGSFVRLGEAIRREMAAADTRARQRKAEEDLEERVKELRCLHDLSRSLQAGGPLGGVLRELAAALPKAFRFPKATSAKVRFDADEYTSDPFVQTAWKLSSDIVANVHSHGCIEVFQMESRAAADHGPFLKEEQELLDELARMLESAIVRSQAEARARHINAVLRAIRNVNQLIVREKEPAEIVRRSCIELTAGRGYSAAWIALTEEDSPFGRLVAEHKYGDAFADLKQRLEKGLVPPCCESAAQVADAYVITNHRQTCPADCPLMKTEGCQQGAMSMIAPIRSKGRTHGFMCVVVPEGLETDKNEASVLQEVTGDIAFALVSIETEIERQQEEERFRLSFDNASIGKALTTPDGKLSRINQAFCDLLGYSREELEAMNFADITHPDDLAESRESVRILLAGEATSYRFDKRYVRKDGQPVATDVSTILLRKPDGSPRHFVTHVIDMSARKRAEHDLAASETRYRRLFESAKDGILILDADTGHIVDANPFLSELTGYSKEELLNKQLWEIGTFKDIASSTAAFEKLRAGGYVRYEDLPLETRDGRQIDVEFISNVYNVDNQRVIQCNIRDISARKRADVALKKSEAQLSNALEMARAGHWEYDVARDMFTFNDNFYRMFRTTAADVGSYEMASAEYARKFCHPDDAALVGEGVRAAIETTDQNFSQQLEHPILYADGDMGHIAVRFSIVKDEKGHTVKTVGVNQDITERKLYQIQIAQSDRLASMGMLAAGVAHEINNPLAYVLYNLESLTDDLPKLSSALRKCLDIIAERIGNEEWAQLMGKDQELLNPAMLDDIRARFKDALQGSHRIRDVARGLGTFSRVDRGRTVPVALMHVIEVAINMAFNEIKYRAGLVKEYGQTSTVMANDGRLSQVFLNLLINAAHAIVEGNVDHNQIKIRTWQEGDEVFAEISDTGKGIAKEHLPHLFEPFFTTKAIGVGTGLGLAISKTIVEEYGGRIEVASEVGKGTSFVVRLPVKKAQELDEAVPATRALAQPEVRGRILVVDDEAGIRSAMVRMLRGHDVVEAVSGNEAQKILEADQAFDLILCDMMMPEMSGVDLHEWLSTIHPDLAKQVVFITGGAFTPRTAQYLAKVSNIRLEKPFDVTNFKKIVVELIVARRNRGS